MGLFAKQVIGVDIGHASVRVLGLQLGKRPKVVGAAEVPVDAQFLQKEGFANHAAIGQAIREAMAQAQPRALTGKEAYVALSESYIFRKVLELPVMADPEEMEQVIRTQAASYLPDSIDAVELDYQILNRSVAKDQPVDEVMIVAVGKRVIEDYRQIFAAAKLSLRAIDPKPSSAGRAIVSPQESEPVLVVDIGSEMSSISVYGNHRVWVTGTVNMGASLFLGDDGQIDQEKLPTAVKRMTASLTDELDHVVKFFANRTSQHGELKEARVTGRGASVTGLVDALGAELDMKVLAGRSVVAMPEGLDSRFYGALGTALYPLHELL